MILGSDKESSEAKDKAIEELLNSVSEVWLQTNASLFKHVLDYKAKLDAFLDKAGGLDKSAGGVHLDDDVSNNRGHWSTIMC